MDGSVSQTQTTPNSLMTGHDASDQLRLIADSIPTILAQFDSEGRYLFINKAHESWFGVPASRVMGRTVTEVLGDVNSTAILPYIQRALRGERVEYEQSFTSTTGITHRFSISYIPVRKPDGSLNGFVANVNDIESLKRIENQLQQSGDQFRRLADAMPQIVWTSDPSGHISYYNKRWYDFTGMRVEDSVGTGWMQAVHPDDLGRSAELWTRSLVTGELYENEVRLKSANGEYRWHLARAVPILDTEGHISRWFGTDTDIDDQRRASELVRKANEEFRLITETIPHGVWRTNPDGTADYFSQQFATYVGYSPEEFLGWGWVGPIHPDDKDRFLKEWKRCRDLGVPISVEFRLQGRDGVYRWFRSDGNPFRDERGEIVKYYGTWTNIDDERRAAEDLKRAKEQAEGASELKSTFLANMSHEIRTPMTAVLGFTEVLRDSHLSEQERQDAISRIDSSGRALLRLIDDILDISKIEAGKLDIQKTRFSPIEIASEVISLMRLAADTKRIGLKLRVDASVPAIAFSDPARIRQILTNLVGNAIKFTSSGEVVLALTTESDRCLVFDVSDTGIGISSKDQGNLFQPFAQADASITRKFGGTGLGLVLSRRLAETLGGSLLLVESEPGKGSRFVARVEGAPFDHVQGFGIPGPTASAPAQASSIPLEIEKPLALMRILLAEDVPDNQVLMRRYLESAGAEVQIANDGEEAVTKASASDFDIVLMDIQMPRLDGIQATKKLRSDGYSKPILALTAHAMTEEITRSINAGCDAHLTKPIKKTDLVAAVRRHVPTHE